jgi:hypothetical protein
MPSSFPLSLFPNLSAQTDIPVIPKNIKNKHLPLKKGEKFVVGKGLYIIVDT